MRTNAGVRALTSNIASHPATVRTRHQCFPSLDRGILGRAFGYRDSAFSNGQLLGLRASTIPAGRSRKLRRFRAREPPLSAGVPTDCCLTKGGAPGASLYEIMKTMGWQPHTVSGFISILGKAGTKIESSKSEAAARTYKMA